MKHHHIYSARGLLGVGLLWVLARIIGIESQYLSGFVAFGITICLLVMFFGEKY